MSLVQVRLFFFATPPVPQNETTNGQITSQPVNTTDHQHAKPFHPIPIERQDTKRPLLSFDLVEEAEQEAPRTCSQAYFSFDPMDKSHVIERRQKFLRQQRDILIQLRQEERRRIFGLMRNEETQSQKNLTPSVNEVNQSEYV